MADEQTAVILPPDPRPPWSWLDCPACCEAHEAALDAEGRHDARDDPDASPAPPTITDAELLALARSFGAGPLPPMPGYGLSDDPAMIEARGRSGWAITLGRSCLGRTGEWEYEAMPSGRSDEFIVRTRWATAREAMAFYRPWAAGMVRRVAAGEGVAP